VSYFTFDDSGNRFEKISYFPMPSFGAVTQEDLNDLQVRYSDFVKASAKVKIIEIENPDAPTKETKPVSPPPRKP
jgi:hypothetical protein